MRSTRTDTTETVTRATVLARWANAVGAAIVFWVVAFTSPLSLASEITQRLSPVDEGPQEPSFVKFRDELKAIIDRKDAAALLAIAPAKIKEEWERCDPRSGLKCTSCNKKSAIWPALSLVVGLGGKFNTPNQFVAPYVYSAWPKGVDRARNSAVTNPNSVITETVYRDSKRIQKLNYDVLAVSPVLGCADLVGSRNFLQHETVPCDWRIVIRDDKLVGFISAGDVRSPLDYRAVFEKRNGKWVIAAFLAGD